MPVKAVFTLISVQAFLELKMNESQIKLPVQAVFLIIPMQAVLKLKFLSELKKAACEGNGLSVSKSACIFFIVTIAFYMLN